jgi:hypothetical protein
MGSVQLRALRNGLVAAAVTAIVGFGLAALFGSDHTSRAEPPSGTPTESPSPACHPSAERLPAQALAGLAGAFTDAWLGHAGGGWAVGYDGDPATDATAVLARWDRTSFAEENGAPASDPIDVLEAVDGSGPDDVWAVGWSSDGYAQNGLSIHFDGTSWSASSAPPGASLLDVRALAPDDAWAVGRAGNPKYVEERAYAAHWDGSSWTEATLPTFSGRSGLYAIDGTADDLWAVGYLHHGPLLLHYDGSEWSRSDAVFTRPPTMAPQRGSLTGVSVAGRTIWVTGSSLFRGNGSRLVPQFKAPPGETLDDVFAVDARTAWAVGTAAAESGPGSRPVAIGVTPDGLVTPTVAAHGAELHAIATAPDGALVAGVRHTGSAEVVPLVATLRTCA